MFPCGYGLKTGALEGGHGDGRQRPQRSAAKDWGLREDPHAMRGVDSVCSELEGLVSLEKGGICNKNNITHCRHWNREAKRGSRREQARQKQDSTNKQGTKRPDIIM